MRKIHISPSSIALICSVVGCLVINYLMGKDLNADMLNYHLYTAHALWTGSYSSDFMGSGLQGFLNPVGYVPFYLMLKSGWHSLLISSAFAAVHALNVWLTWSISWHFLFRSSPDRLSCSILSGLLGAVSPVFFAVLGSSFLDPVVSLLTLGSIFLACSGLLKSPTSVWRLAGAGAMLGAATGLKLSGIPAAAIAFLALALVSVKFQRPGAVSTMAWFAVGMTIGALATGGFWAFQLWEEFRNPIYPLANHIFKSPDFAPIALTADRFVPQSVPEILEFPFRMIKPNSGTYVEIMAPDLRFALIVLGALAAAVLAAARRALPRFAVHHQVAIEAPSLYVILFFMLGTVVWMAVVGNGRYHLHLLLLAGPIVVLLSQQIFGLGRMGRLVCLLILAAQLAHANVSGYPRWDSGQWTPIWLKVEVAESLAAGPGNYLVLGPGVDSATAAFLPAGSHFVELAARSPIDPDSPEGRRIRELIQKQDRPSMALLRVPTNRASAQLASAHITPQESGLVNELLGPWNMRVSDSHCSFMRVTLDEETAGMYRGEPVQLGARQYALMACPVEPGGSDDHQLAETRRLLAAIKHNLESQCPLLFRAPGTFPIRLGEVWNVRYFATDIYVTLLNGELTYSRYPYGPFSVPIPLTKDLKLAESFDCKKPKLPW